MLGQVSLLISTEPPSSVVKSGRIVTSGRSLKAATAACESRTCQPKCQIALCGRVGGGAAALSNSTSTLFGVLSAAIPPQLPFVVLGKRPV